MILTTELTLAIERHIAPADGKVFGKTIARRSQGAWPPSAVYCFNGDDVPRLGEILAYFDGAAPEFYLVHGGYTPEVGAALHAAGFRVVEWKQTVLYGLPLREPARLPDGVTIEHVTAANVSVAADVAAEGNAWPDAWREAAKEGVRQSIHRRGYQLYLARRSGEPAGVADLTGESWRTLGGAAVVPRHRGRGIHAALIHHRMHEAFKAGCELVIGAADFGSPSFRNQQRLGMRLAFVETVWRR